MTIDKENSFQNPLSTIKEDKQFDIEVYKELYSKDYIVFIQYEDFKKYLIENQIISRSLKNYENIKNKRIQNILSFLEAHINSYFHIFNKGYKYAIMNKTVDLHIWRAKSYENDFKEWFNIVNDECEDLCIKYIFSYNDIEDYNKKNLEY